MKKLKGMNMKHLIVTFFILVASVFSLADDQHFKGFVKIGPDRELYVDYLKGKPNAPTVVLLNGLTYGTKEWDKFTDELSKYGVGILRFDPMAMGQTLLKYAPITAAVQIEDQARDLHSLVQALKIESKLNLAGLSYGGGLAMVYCQLFPENVNKLILMAPFTQPVEEQDKWIRSQIWYIRIMQPWNSATDDELYDYFLKTLVYTSYPIAEPIALENPFKLEGIFRLVQGIRKWNAGLSLSSFPEKSVNLIIAENDQYVKRPVLDAFWKSVPISARASYMVIRNSEHKIPEAVPRFAAAWIQEILNDNRTILEKQSFEGDPQRGIVHFKGGSFNLFND